VEPADPNKPASELNHHLAGYALIAIALLICLGESSPKRKIFHRVWPLLFIATGLFLALWSDREIWPRGNLSWAWLIQHDFEARQHKIFALLLLLIGVIEYARTGDRLSRFWRVWAFPFLALSGAGLLLLHDHSQGSGASSPEAQAYRVSWSRAPTQVVVQDHPTSGEVAPAHHHGTNGVQSTSDVPTVNGSDHEQHDKEISTPAQHHDHHMTASAMKVEREHLWFVMVGVAVAVFKFLRDGNFWKRPLAAFVWPGFMSVLGLLLVVYKE